MKYVSMNGHRAAFTRDAQANKLIIIPRKPVSGTFSTTVVYSGKPVTHIDPDGAVDGWIPTEDGATLLAEPVGAMTWFPNTPNDKATYRIAVKVPAAPVPSLRNRLLSTRLTSRRWASAANNKSRRR